ncbi:MAG TPA: hypothetical protein VF546_22845 [Pyrinomonadaceae bacterium]|jgi:hypothetical protein
MTQTLKRAAVALALCALLGGSVLADTKSKNVRFDEDLSVGGTLVKKGSYKVSFDDQTGELTVSRGSKVVATAKAKLEEIKNTVGRSADYKTRRTDEAAPLTLTSIKLGDAYAVIGDAAAGASSSNAQ